MAAYNHATLCTKNGYVFVDSDNDTRLKEKYRIRNFIAPIYPGTHRVKSQSQSPCLGTDKAYLKDPITAIAKRGHQYIYADPAESPTV